MVRCLLKEIRYSASSLSLHYVCTTALKWVNPPNQLSSELQETTSCFLPMSYKSKIVCSSIAACQEDGIKLLKTYLWLIYFSCNIRINSLHLRSNRLLKWQEYSIHWVAALPKFHVWVIWPNFILIVLRIKRNNHKFNSHYMTRPMMTSQV